MEAFNEIILDQHRQRGGRVHAKRHDLVQRQLPGHHHQPGGDAEGPALQHPCHPPHQEDGAVRLRDEDPVDAEALGRVAARRTDEQQSDLLLSGRSETWKDHEDCQAIGIKKQGNYGERETECQRFN